MLRLVVQWASLWRGTLIWCGLLLTLPVGGTSSLDLTTRPFESGMLILELQLANPSRGTLAMCILLHFLPRGNKLSLALVTEPFESGMQRLALQWVFLRRDTLIKCNLWLTHLMDGTSSLDPLIRLFGFG